jgi:hypothetical protein
MIAAKTKVGKKRPFILRRKKQAVFRLLVWFFAIYFLIGALHGAAPQLWSRHYDKDQQDGPFRVLLFSVLLPIAFLVLLLPVMPRPCLRESAPAFPVREKRWTPRSLRGPPRLF